MFLMMTKHILIRKQIKITMRKNINPPVKKFFLLQDSNDTLSYETRVVVTLEKYIN